MKASKWVWKIFSASRSQLKSPPSLTDQSSSEQPAAPAPGFLRRVICAPHDGTDTHNQEPTRRLLVCLPVSMLVLELCEGRDLACVATAVSPTLGVGPRRCKLVSLNASACLLSCSRESAQCPAPCLPSAPFCAWSWTARRKHLVYKECWVLLPPWLLGGTPAFER